MKVTGMWAVVDADDDAQAPFAIFPTKDEALGYVGLTGGTAPGCIEIAVREVDLEVTEAAK